MEHIERSEAIRGKTVHLTWTEGPTPEAPPGRAGRAARQGEAALRSIAALVVFAVPAAAALLLVWWLSRG